MAIRCEHAIEVEQGPERAFAVLDDVSRTPEWLERCTGIEKLTPGPNALGTRLRYYYREGSRVGSMEGEIMARVPNEHLLFHYHDKMMEVVVDFLISKAAGGTRLTHTIEITPKTFFAKLFSPLIRRQLPKQTITAMERLRRVLEADERRTV